MFLIFPDGVVHVFYPTKFGLGCFVISNCFGVVKHMTAAFEPVMVMLTHSKRANARKKKLENSKSGTRYDRKTCS